MSDPRRSYKMLYSFQTAFGRGPRRLASLARLPQQHQDHEHGGARHGGTR